MTTSPSNIRVLRPKYSSDATARAMEEEYDEHLIAAPSEPIDRTESEARTRRDQLKVISGQLKRTPIGFSVFVLSIPVIALLIVLVVNIVVSNRQYEMVELSRELTSVSQSNEALAQQLSQKSAPQSVAQQAADMGMVMPGIPASIDLSAGKVLGTATAAEAENTPTSFVSEPTVRSSTGIPSVVEAPVNPDAEPITVTNEGIPGPESNTVKIISPQISVPSQNETNQSAENGVAQPVQTSSVGSLQGPQVNLPADN